MVMLACLKPTVSAMVSATAAGPGLQLKTGRALTPTAAADFDYEILNIYYTIN